MSLGLTFRQKPVTFVKSAFVELKNGAEEGESDSVFEKFIESSRFH